MTNVICAQAYFTALNGNNVLGRDRLRLEFKTVEDSRPRACVGTGDSAVQRSKSPQRFRSERRSWSEAVRSTRVGKTLCGTKVLQPAIAIEFTNTFVTPL